jgi:hypothetical protein
MLRAHPRSCRCARRSPGDYINPDADPESVLADLGGVLAQLRDLTSACETYKEYQARAGKEFIAA